MIGRAPTPTAEVSASCINPVGLDLGPSEPIVSMSHEYTHRAGTGLPATIVRLPYGDTKATEADISEFGQGGGGEFGEVRRRGAFGHGNGGRLAPDVQKAHSIGVPSDTPGLRSRWNAEISVTTPYSGLVSRSEFLPRRVKNVHFSNIVCAIVGDRSKVDINSEYSVNKVHIDVDAFVKGLSGKSESALKEFVKNPRSDSACARFQATLPGGEPTPVEHHTELYRAELKVAASIEDCAVAVIGDDGSSIVEADYAAPTGELDLSPILRSNKSVAKALAHALANRGDPAAQHSFDQCIVEAISPDILGSFLDGTHFDTGETKIRRRGSTTRVKGAIATTLGEGNMTRSHITLRAHKVAKLDKTALAELADKYAPTPASFGAAPPVVVAPSGAAARLARMQQEQEALDMVRRAEQLRRALEELERRRNGDREDGS